MADIDPVEDDVLDGAIEDILRTFDAEFDEICPGAELPAARAAAKTTS